MTSKTLESARELDRAREKLFEVGTMRDQAIQFRNDLQNVGAGRIAIQAANEKVAKLEEPFKKATEEFNRKFDAYEAAVIERHTPVKKHENSLEM